MPKLEASRNFTRNNFSEWKEALTKYAMLHYQQLGLLFRDDEYYVPREIEVPNDLTLITFLQRADLEAQVRQRSNLIQKMLNDRISLYAFMWNTLSESSQTLLMREAEWQTAEDESDPLKLWLIIKATHLGNQGNMTTRRLIPGETNRLLLENLNETKMYPNEYLSKYLKRFYTSLDAYEGAGIDPPDHAMVVAIFIQNLCDENDLLVVVNYLSARVDKFTKSDVKKLHRCLRYLNKTKNEGLRLKVDLSNGKLKLLNMTDASYASREQARSQSGTFITLGCGSIYSTSRKQKLTAQSASEAELIAAVDGAKMMMAMRNYLESRGYPIAPMTLYQDNKASQFVIEKGARSAKKLKHLHVKYFALTDYVNDGLMEVRRVDTENMVADLLTKPIVGERFEVLREILLGRTPVPC